jgi:hypothetical protein
MDQISITSRIGNFAGQIRLEKGTAARHYDEFVDEAAWAARSAREKVILWGLIDWVELERVHDFVAEENPGTPLSVTQDETLNLIRSVVADAPRFTGSGPQRVRRSIRRQVDLAVVLLARSHGQRHSRCARTRSGN